MSRAKDRSKDKGIPLSVTLDDLKAIWDAQDGICPITGWTMWLLPGTRVKRSMIASDPVKQASLDRIDSGQGYHANNVRFVCLMAQFAKNHWTDEQLLAFCQAVSERHGLC